MVGWVGSNMKIISFSVTNAIRSLSSAQVEALLDGTDLASFAIGSLLTLSVVYHTAVSATPVTDVVFVGRVKTWTPINRVSDGANVYSITAVSVQSLLTTTPIVTEKFSSATATTVIQWIFTLAGLVQTAGSAYWHSASGGETFTDTIDENSALDALEKIAMVSEWIWHIKSDGKMYFEALGAGLGGVVQTFAPENISGDVQQSYQEYDQVSAFKIRGQYKPPNATFVTLLAWGNHTVAPENFGDKVGYVVFNLGTQYSYASVKSAIVITGDTALTPVGSVDVWGEVQSYVHPIVTVKLTTTHAEGFTAVNQNSIYCKVIADVVPISMIEGIDARGLGCGQGSMSYSRDGASQMMRYSSGSYAIFDRQSNRLTHEAAQDRYEQIVSNAALQLQMGFRIREMDIPYARQYDTGSGVYKLGVIGELLLKTIYREGRRITFSGPYCGIKDVNVKYKIPVIESGRHKSVLSVLQYIGSDSLPTILDAVTIRFTASSSETIVDYSFLSPLPA